MITKEEQREPVERYLQSHPLENIEFYYVDIPAFYKKIFKGFMYSGRLNVWNKRALPLAKKICADNKVDIVHQITPVPRGASSLLLRRLQGRREPTEKPGTHEENAGEKAGRLLRFAASKGLTFRAFLRVFPGREYLITFLPGLPSYFVTSSTSGHVDPRHRKEGSLGDSTRIRDFESCHL